MRNLYLLTAMLVCSFFSQGQCIQTGDFESSLTQLNNLYVFTTKENGFDIFNCNVDTSTGFSADFNATQNNLNSKATRVTGTGVDAILASHSVNVDMVHTGNAAIKLNNNPNTTSGLANGTLTTMSQNFTASSTDLSFFFSLIVEDAHQEDSPQDQPFFTARIYNSSNEIINTNDFCITADPNNPVFTGISNTEILYTDWQCGRLNIPSEYIGQTVRLEFVVTDCGQIQHYGTVYIDDITCDASCENPPLGFIELDPIQYNCPNEPFNVCGTFSEPLDSDLQSITLEIIQDGNIIQTLTNPQITGDVYCFTVNPYDFGITGDFEIFASADFEMSNNFILTLFDQSSVPGTDITFSLVNPSEAEVHGSILFWPDISDSYEVEFVSDNTCCPGGAQMEGSYSASLTSNQIDLDIVLAALQNKCFRWRIRTEECGNWSEWCCLAYDSENEFPNADYGNLLGDVCYPSSGCVPTLHATFTESGTIFEQRMEWITAVNTINASADVDYQAGEYIELQPGFNTVTGAIFLAHIDDCIIPTFALKNLTSNHSSEDQNGGMSERFEMQNHNKYNVYPNPSKGNITVQFEGTVSSFTIHDVTGKQLMTVQGNSNGEVQLDLSNLAKGVYMLSADGMPVEKIIKN